VSATTPLLTAADLAAHFGIAEKTVLKFARQYQWPRTQLGDRTLRWTPEQLEQIEARHSVSDRGVMPTDGRTSRSARRSA
jgi:predicted DNA-binding transcriptional regulator AlpA